MKNLLLSITAFMFVLCQTAFSVETGAMAPEFKLQDINGKKHSLSLFKGKMVVIEWLNWDCPFVVKHYSSGNMPKLQSQWVTKDVVWLSIVSSAKGKQGYYSDKDHVLRAEKEKYAGTAILIDADGKVGKTYGATSTPHMFVIDTTGKIVYQGAIDDKATTDQADVKLAKNYVSEALESILAGQPVKSANTRPYGCSVKY
ncbi:MAG: thioredoxin family protein [Verrucomicrobiota bacterium]|nr:thioredoxin family protein [Verrucomicrobiota bacterium]